MDKQNVVYMHVDEEGNKITLKLQFEHCNRCLYFDSCYKKSGTGQPMFIDPTCVEGPV